MNNVLSEKDYQKFLLERLADNGYVIRKGISFRPSVCDGSRDANEVSG